ncbi:MAG: GreA/GreB family elongation factor [Pseudonocardiales bacterium]|nr:GreA/GreB family elongation factor [Pseudonocardiales bacterium]MBV9030430.1 GreA/GreB family elongation factor [Pseudonocardiales bacterium]MBW0009315.1 GreA/GreB family elongation factor [Pseudonocardiales bacterium]
MSPTTPGLSADGRERLEREVALLREQRREPAADLSDADPVGDRADQAELLERADDLAQLDGRIKEIVELLTRAGWTDERPGGLVDGTVVTLRFADGTVETLRAVMVTDEASEDEGAQVLTVDSPLGLALAGRHAGDTVTYRTPDGETSVDILAVAPPSGLT